MRFRHQLVAAGMAALSVLGMSDAFASGTLTALAPSTQIVTMGDPIAYKVLGTGTTCNFIVTLRDSNNLDIASKDYATQGFPTQATFPSTGLAAGNYALNVVSWQLGDACAGGPLNAVVKIIAPGGSITGMTPATQTIVGSGTADYSVSGTGSCGFLAALVDSNGTTVGSPQTHLNNTSWPRTVSFPVSVKGDYSVVVGSLGGPTGCTGSKTSALHVLASFKPPALPPAITSGTKELFPNGFFILSGTGFGPAAGTINVKFIEKTVSVPIGSPASDWWFSGVTAGTLPNVVGVTDQTVTITLTTQSGATATWQAHFTPRMEIKSMSLGDNRAKMESCSKDGVANFCFAAAGNLQDPGECAHFGVGLPLGGLVSLENNTFVGQHHGCWGLNTDSGVDSYSLALQNGWKINSFDLASTLDNGSVTLFGGIKFIGLSNAVYPIQWSIGKNGGDVSYAAIVTIKGPKGLPF